MKLHRTLYNSKQNSFYYSSENWLRQNAGALKMKSQSLWIYVLMQLKKCRALLLHTIITGIHTDAKLKL